jgi:hypothetical protein
MAKRANDATRLPPAAIRKAVLKHPGPWHTWSTTAVTPAVGEPSLSDVARYAKMYC